MKLSTPILTSPIDVNRGLTVLARIDPCSIECRLSSSITENPPSITCCRDAFPVAWEAADLVAGDVFSVQGTPQPIS